MLARADSTLLALTLCAISTSCATSGHSTTLRIENDNLPFGGDLDRHYTQGVRIDQSAEFAAAPGWARSTAAWFERFDLGFLDRRPKPFDSPHALGGFVAQQIYTPSDISQADPGPDERPYTGWLYAGMRSTTTFAGDAYRRDDSQTTMELSLGTTGGASLAEFIQTHWHELIGIGTPKGWDHQLHGEPTLQLGSQHTRRLIYGRTQHWLGADLCARASYNAGNFLTNAGVGTTFRAGYNVPRDFALPYIETTAKFAAAEAPLRPAPEEPCWSLYGFIGCDGRGVLRNLSLDGNSFHSGGLSVDRKAWVGDLVIGGVLRIGGLEVGYSTTQRSVEFDEQDGAQSFSSIYFRLSLTDE